MAWISREAHTKEKVTALVRGDIILSKTAYPAASVVTLDECNVSQDTIAIKLSEGAKKSYKAEYIVIYLNSRLGRTLLEAEFQGNVQEHLGLSDAKTLPVPALSSSLQAKVQSAFSLVLSSRGIARRRINEAEEMLSAALGLADWSPPEPLAYSASSNAALQAGRLDAQFFSPRYDDLFAHIKATKQAVRFGDVLSANVRGNQPLYAEVGLPVINSKHVRANRIEPSDQRIADPGQANVLIQEGDLLINGTGVGTIGRAAPWLAKSKAIPDNHVTVLRADGLDPVYLSVFLNSRIGQMQVERHTKGSSGQVELYPSDIAEFMIWRAPDGMQKAIRRCVLDAFAADAKAQSLLDAAKRAVEIAIEKSEPAALKFLKATGA